MTPRSAHRIFRIVAVAATLALAGTAPAASPAIDAVVKDDKGKPVEDAVVYLVSPPGAAPAAARARTRAVMDQWKQEFIPYVLAVEAATTVNFPNRDNIKHHVYSFSSPKKFELPLYSGTPAAPLVFDTPGVVVLGCNIHDWMVGYIYVLPTPYFAKTGADGKARLESVPAGAREVRVWHPRLRDATEKTGQTVTPGAGGAGEVAFAVVLKREWRIPRPAGSRYDPKQQN